MSDPTTAARALAEAVAADTALWTDDHDYDAHRRARNRAITAALAAGMPKEQVADTLGVRISDLERMVAEGQPSPT